MSGLKMLLQSMGFDIEAVKADMTATITKVQETLSAIAAALARLEGHATYTRAQVDRVVMLVTNGPPVETATSQLAIAMLEAHPELEGQVLEELTADRPAREAA